MELRILCVRSSLKDPHFIQLEHVEKKLDTFMNQYYRYKMGVAK